MNLGLTIKDLKTRLVENLERLTKKIISEDDLDEVRALSIKIDSINQTLMTLEKLSS